MNCPLKPPNFVFLNGMASLYVFGASNRVSKVHTHLVPYVNMQLQARDSFLKFYASSKEIWNTVKVGIQILFKIKAKTL